MNTCHLGTSPRGSVVIFYFGKAIRSMKTIYVQGGAGGLQQTFVDSKMAVPLPDRVWRHGGTPVQKSTKVCRRPPAPPCSCCCSVLFSRGSMHQRLVGPFNAVTPSFRFRPPRVTILLLFYIFKASIH